MKTELEAAVERVRRFHTGNESYREVYGIDRTGGGMLDIDRDKVIQAYLAHLDAEAARKSEGDLLVGEAWLRSLPGVSISYGKTFLGTCLCFSFDGVDVCLYDYKPYGIKAYGTRDSSYPHLLDNPTRRQVLALIEALGGKV